MTRAEILQNLADRRQTIEANIIKLFENAQNTAATKEYGVGKNTIKRALMLNDKQLKISINTVKIIVDGLIAKGIIECSNPEKHNALKFRLVEK